jgi:hypothetical protein
MKPSYKDKAAMNINNNHSGGNNHQKKKAISTPKRDQDKQLTFGSFGANRKPAPAHVRTQWKEDIVDLEKKLADLRMKEEEDDFRQRKRAYFKDLSRYCPWLDWLMKDCLAELWAKDPERTCESIVADTPNPLEFFEHQRQRKQEEQLQKTAEATAAAFCCTEEEVTPQWTLLPPSHPDS